MRSLLLLLAVPAALAADYELVASGKECQTSGSWKDWKGSGKTLDQCRAEVLADWDCDPTYFEFANDANCRCAQEDSDSSTDCSQSSNQNDNSNMKIYRINSAPHELGHGGLRGATGMRLGLGLGLGVRVRVRGLQACD